MKSETNRRALSSSTSLSRDISQTDEDEFHSADEDSLLASLPPVYETDVFTASYHKFQIDLKRMQILLIDNDEVFEKFKTTLNKKGEIDLDFICSKYYILTPLDLFFNIHQCIYQGKFYLFDM
jgi:hypothetical protein